MEYLMRTRAEHKRTTQNASGVDHLRESMYGAGEADLVEQAEAGLGEEDNDEALEVREPAAGPSDGAPTETDSSEIPDHPCNPTPSGRKCRGHPGCYRVKKGKKPAKPRTVKTNPHPYASAKKSAASKQKKK